MTLRPAPVLSILMVLASVACGDRGPSMAERAAATKAAEAAADAKAREATRLRIEFPERAGGTRTASFEVAGLDETQMPGW